MIPQQQPQQQPTPKLTPRQKLEWNNFLDFMDKSGYKGSPVLDERDKNLGKFLFDKYKSMTKGVTLDYRDVPRVQQELQDYRTDLVNKYKKGLVQADSSVKTDADIMPNLSQVDGWLGSKTSSHKFPVAIGTQNVNGAVKTTNYGTDLDKYNAVYQRKSR